MRRVGSCTYCVHCWVRVLFVSAYVALQCCEMSHICHMRVVCWCDMYMCIGSNIFSWKEICIALGCVSDVCRDCVWQYVKVCVSVVCVCVCVGVCLLHVML